MAQPTSSIQEGAPHTEEPYDLRFVSLNPNRPTSYTEMNIFEQYELREAGRQEARASAIQALQEHLARLNNRASFTDFDHPYHAGSRSAVEFAITLVKLAI